MSKPNNPLDVTSLVRALSSFVDDSKWQNIGTFAELSQRPCTKFYPLPDEEEDPNTQIDELAVFFVSPDRFYAIDCSCPHEGGPLDLGDIEDLGGNLSIICPWHSYDFDLVTGKSETGLQTNTYEVMVAEGNVYVQYDMQLSADPACIGTSTPSYGKGANNSSEKFETSKHTNQMENLQSVLGKGEDREKSDSMIKEMKSLTIANGHSATEGPALAQINGSVDSQQRMNNDMLIQTTQEDTLCGWAKEVLLAADPVEKVRLTRLYFTEFPLRYPDSLPVGRVDMPAEPSRTDDLHVVMPGKIKRGKGGTLASRISLLHSLANIEQWAIDLSWDVVGRFANHTINGERMPAEFFQDFIKVANDEAKHYTMLDERLREMGSHFGALPVHNGLWQSATDTAHDFLARLAIVHMVHEARGLDVHPKTASRFSQAGDRQTVEMLDVIYEDEITHVACGMKWFNYACQMSDPPLEPISTFHQLVKKHFKGYLKPPFDTSGRSTAGMTERWYEPLVKPQIT